MYIELLPLTIRNFNKDRNVLNGKHSRLGYTYFVHATETGGVDDTVGTVRQVGNVEYLTTYNRMISPKLIGKNPIKPKPLIHEQHDLVGTGVPGNWALGNTVHVPNISIIGIRSIAHTESVLVQDCIKWFVADTNAPYVRVGAYVPYDRALHASLSTVDTDQSVLWLMEGYLREVPDSTLKGLGLRLTSYAKSNLGDPDEVQDTFIINVLKAATGSLGTIEKVNKGGRKTTVIMPPKPSRRIRTPKIIDK